MKAFTYTHHQIEAGIKLVGGTIVLGEEGRGRTRVELPIEGAIGDRVIAVSAQGQAIPEDSCSDTFLVRMLPLRQVHRQHVSIEKQAGEPELVAKGNFASGIAGYAGSAEDSLWILQPGDVLLVYWSGKPNRVVQNAGGYLTTTHFLKWEITQAEADPGAYAAKGKVLFGRSIPKEWVGRVVSVLSLQSDEGRPYLEASHTGELISISPLMLNLGWDGGDRHDVQVSKGTWIQLEAKKEVKRPMGADLSQREELRSQIGQLVRKASEVAAESWFGLLDGRLQEELGQIARMQPSDFDTMPNDGREGLGVWIERARTVFDRLAEVEKATRELERRQNAGEILVGFEAWHRRGGMTNLGDGWVVRADGTFRPHDNDDVPRHKRDGTYRWNLVEPDELALRWSGGISVEVAHRPVNSLTESQLTAVTEIEQEIGAPEGLFGFDRGVTGINSQRLEAIRQVLRRRLGSVPLNGDYQGAPEYEFPEFERGVIVDKPPSESLMRRVNLAQEPTEEFANRGAHLVDQIPAADGVVRLLVFQKFGRWNLGVVWQEQTT